MMVVVVLMTSCQVSENLKMGPSAAQQITRAQQPMNTSGRPVHLETAPANFVNARVAGPIAG